MPSDAPADVVCGPLADTLARIGAQDEYCRYVAGQPCDDGWLSLGDAVEGPEIDVWLAQVRTADAGGHRDVAGSYVAAWVAGRVADTAAAAIRHERRAWPISPDNVLVHRHTHGWIDGLAVRRPTIRVLPDDPARDHPDSDVVPDIDALRDLAASEIVATLTVVFGAVRARVPFGLRGMWGSLADGLGGDAALDAFNRGIDVSEPWREAMQLLDAIAARTPLMRVRPRLRALEWSGGVSSVVVRGTCCLYYKTHDAPDPRGEGYCTSCPLRDPDDQLDRWRDWLEATYGHAAIDTTGRSQSLI